MADIMDTWRDVVVPKAMSDQGARDQILADPIGALRAEGATVPDGVTAEVVQNQSDKIYLVFPADGSTREQSGDAVAEYNAACF